MTRLLLSLALAVTAGAAWGQTTANEAMPAPARISVVVVGIVLFCLGYKTMGNLDSGTRIGVGWCLCAGGATAVLLSIIPWVAGL